MRLNNLELSCLTELQAAKWFLLHERQRHIDDILEIDKDLAKLKDIAIPVTLEVLTDLHFTIPEA